MSEWTGTAQAYLDAGEPPTFHVALYALPKRLDTGAVIEVGYWSGVDDVALVIDGQNRAYNAVGAALVPEVVRDTLGTNIRTTRLQMFGLSEQGKDLYRDLNVEQAPAELHHVLMNVGGVILGTRQLIRGVVERCDLDIQAGGSGANLSIEIAGRMQAGTRVIQAKKSHQSYQRRGGDTAMQYASLRDAEGDTWK